MPEQEIHITQPPPPKAPDSMAENFKKFVPSASFALICIIGTFLWNSNGSQSELKFQVEQNRLAMEKMLVNEKEKNEAMNQMLIAINKLSDAQNRMASDMKDMQDQQRRNTEALINRK